MKRLLVALVYQKGNEPVIPEGLRVVEFRLGKEDNAVAPEISQDDAFADSVEYYQDLIDRNKEKGEKYNNTGNILLVSGGVALLLGSVLIFDAVNGSAGPLGAWLRFLTGGTLFLLGWKNIVPTWKITRSGNKA